MPDQRSTKPKWYTKAKERMALMKRFATGTDVHLLEMACADYDRLRPRVRELERRLAAVVTWVEQNQPDAFSRGLWDAIRGSQS